LQDSSPRRQTLGYSSCSELQLLRSIVPPTSKKFLESEEEPKKELVMLKPKNKLKQKQQLESKLPENKKKWLLGKRLKKMRRRRQLKMKKLRRKREQKRKNESRSRQKKRRGRDSSTKDKNKRGCSKCSKRRK